MIALLLLLGCNEYALFVAAGDARDDRPIGVDVLFVLDDSESMTAESLALAQRSGALVDALLAEPDGAEPVDVRLAVTTTDARADGGRILGPVVGRDDPDLREGFEAALLCEAACFPRRDAVPSDPTHRCGDPAPEITAEHLDCVCGEDAWVGHCGSDDEEALEAVLLAMCRAAPDPPPVCFDRPEVFGPDDVRTQDGLLTDGRALVPVVVTDEGDGSRRLPDYHELPDSYLDAFRRFEVPMRWAVVAPTLDAHREVGCPGVATSWGLLRYDILTEGSGGLRADLYDEDCAPADFAPVLARIGELVLAGPATFTLPGRADPDSIVVFVGGEQIDAAPAWVDPYGFPRYGDGWSYRATDQTVTLHGEAVPRVGAEVEIYYLPART